MSHAHDLSSAALLVKGPGADAARLSEVTGLAFRQVRRSGQPSPIGPPVARHDSCALRSAVAPDAPLDDHLRALILDVEGRLADIRACCPEAEVTIWCSYQSELAQMHASLSPDVLAKVGSLGLRIDLSIFSWGGVEDDGQPEAASDQ